MTADSKATSDLDPLTDEAAATWLMQRRVAFVGKLGGVNRRQARQLLRDTGATMVDATDDQIDLIVIGADQIPGESDASLLNEATIAAAAAGKLEIITETQFWQRLGRVDSETESRRLYTPAMLAQLLQLPLATIRRWHRRGLITPVQQINKLPYFDFEQVTSARRIAGWIAQGQSPSAIESKLTQLAEMFPGLQLPLGQLNVMVRDGNVLLRQGGGLIEPGGQMLIDFDSVEAGSAGDLACEPPILEFAPRDALAAGKLDRSATPLDYMRLAWEFEDEGDLPQAIQTYRSLLLGFGPSAEGNFRLAELLYSCGDLQAARERYYAAVELDESFVEARASLGCVLAELGETTLAISAFEGALKVHPDYPDVHFHLARLLDELGSESAATHHWQRFLSLAPRSPWSDEARQRLQVAMDDEGD